MGRKSSKDKRIISLGEKLEENHRILYGILSLLDFEDSFGNFEEVFYNNPLTGNKAASLKPCRRHLDGILNLLECDTQYNDLFRRSVEKSDLSDHVWEMRLQLTIPSSEASEEFRKTLRSDKPLKKWMFLEGPSHPDLYIENENYIFLAEGKRTENSLTEDVAYIPQRSQMVRHIENAISSNPGKKVIACYILDEDFLDKKDCEKASFLKEMDMESVALDSKMKEEMASSFYGYITWSELETLGVSFED